MSNPRIEPAAAGLFKKKKRKVVLEPRVDESRVEDVDKTVQKSEDGSVVPPASPQPVVVPPAEAGVVQPRRRG